MKLRDLETARKLSGELEKLKWLSGQAKDITIPFSLDPVFDEVFRQAAISAVEAELNQRMSELELQLKNLGIEL